MKILSWNILSGGGTRIARISEVIGAHGADTVALSEVTEKRTAELRAALEALGFGYFHVPPIPARARGVLVASKAAFVAHKHGPRNALPEHRWAVVSFPGKRFTLVNTYFPATGPGVREFWPQVHAACSELRKRAVLLVGDLNSGHSAFDAQRGTLSGDPWFNAMPSLGYTDLWRHRHRSSIEYSWFSQRGGRSMNGFRIDHAFGTEALRRRVRSVHYSHAERADRTSDHSSLIVTLQ